VYIDPDFTQPFSSHRYCIQILTWIYGFNYIDQYITKKGVTLAFNGQELYTLM